MHKPLVIALTLALVLPAAAADNDAETHAKTIAPFLDEQTFAVVRLDLTKAKAGDLLAAFGPFTGMEAAGAKDLETALDRWLGDFAKAGGREVYLVFSLADVPDFPFVVVPLAEGADADKIADLLKIGFGPLGGRPGEKRGSAVFAGSPAAGDRLRSLKPAARPELATAFAAAGDGIVQAAVIPPPHLARVFDEMMPVLPKEAGGGPSKPLTHGLKWAALGLDAPPKMTLRLTIQSPDAASAKAFNDALGKLLKALGELKEVREALPQFEKLAPMVQSAVEGDRLALSLEREKGLAVVEPLVRRAVQVAGRRGAASNLRQLVLAVHNYADGHKGYFPPVASSDKAGKPLLSWRVHLLPSLGQEQLYKEFHLDEPWDSEHNKKLIAKMPDVFRGPNPRLNEQGKTVYLAPVGKDVAFTGNATGRRMPAEFLDGTSNTILFVEADDAHAVEWTRPEDLKVDLDKPHAGLGQRWGRFVVATADGYVHFLKPTISKQTLRYAFEVNDGQPLGSDWD